MRSRISILVMIVCLGSTAQAFEGTLKWRTVSGKITSLAALGAKAGDPQSLLALSAEKIAQAPGVTKSEFTLLVKGSRVKEVSPTAEASYVLVDGKSGQIWMAAPSHRRYMEWTGADRELLQQRLDAMEKKREEQIDKLSGAARDNAQKQLEQMRTAAKATPEFKDLDKPEKIAGLDTEVFEVTLPGREARAWLAKQPADLADTFRGVYAARAKMQGGAGIQNRDFKEVVSAKGIPARVLSVQGENFKLDDIVAIKPGPVDEQAVAVPADYEKVSLQEFLKAALKTKVKVEPQAAPPPPSGAGEATDPKKSRHH